VDGNIIGEIGLHDWRNRRSGSASFGVSILDPNYLGQGYGREAINLLLDWSFRIMNYRRIHLETLASNERAVRCYRSCSFVERHSTKWDAASSRAAPGYLPDVGQVY
jgi:RimJ/RimL family protein N-acetyltransferase